MPVSYAIKSLQFGNTLRVPGHDVDIIAENQPAAVLQKLAEPRERRVGPRSWQLNRGSPELRPRHTEKSFLGFLDASVSRCVVFRINTGELWD